LQVSDVAKYIVLRHLFSIGTRVRHAGNSLAKGRRTPSQVHRYVENLASDHPQQFSLRMALLVMQPAKNISRGERLIVLHEPFPDSEFGHDFFVIPLQKKTTLVPEDPGVREAGLREVGWE
jgi:hypothetical protein